MTPGWREQLEREPEIRPHLERLARKFIRTGVAPKSFTFNLGPSQPAVRRALEFLFGGGVLGQVLVLAAVTLTAIGVLWIDKLAQGKKVLR